MTRREETTAEGYVLTRHPAWRPQIEAAGTHEEIITVFRLFGARCGRRSSEVSLQPYL